MPEHPSDMDRWICQECGQKPGFNADWKWTGETWVHRHEDGEFNSPGLRPVVYVPPVEQQDTCDSMTCTLGVFVPGRFTVPIIATSPQYVICYRNATGSSYRECRREALDNIK